MVIPKDRMTDVLYDYHMALSLGNSGAFGTSRHERALYKQSVFDKHGISEAQFDSSMVWYTRHTKELAQMYKVVSERMKVERRDIERLISIRDKKPMISDQGDTVNVWPWNTELRLSCAALDNLYTFSLFPDSNYRDNDSLVWEVYSRYLSSATDSMREASVVMELMMKYETGIRVSRIRQVAESGRMHVSVQDDTLGVLKRLSGMLYFLGDSCTEAVVADSVRLMRYRVKRAVSDDKPATADADTLAAHSVAEEDAAEPDEKNTTRKSRMRKGGTNR